MPPLARKSFREDVKVIDLPAEALKATAGRGGGSVMGCSRRVMGGLWHAPLGQGGRVFLV